MAAPLLPPFIRKMQNQQPITNWAGNLIYSTTNIEYPASVDAMQQLVKKYDKVKVLGTRHCFNTIADSKDRFISLRDMNKIIALDEHALTVTVEGGIKYGELAPWLNDKGYALHNLASLPHISVAGAITTATHGSGVKNGNLSSAVEALELSKSRWQHRASFAQRRRSFLCSGGGPRRIRCYYQSDTKGAAHLHDAPICL